MNNDEDEEIERYDEFIRLLAQLMLDQGDKYGRTNNVMKTMITALSATICEHFIVSKMSKERLLSLISNIYDLSEMKLRMQGEI